MSIRMTHIRLSGGTSHEHIERLWWSDPGNGKSGNNPRAEIVAWIEGEDGKAYVEDRQGHRANVGVVKPTYGAKYLRTYADGVWTNNLLSLPHK